MLKQGIQEYTRQCPDIILFVVCSSPVADDRKISCSNLTGGASKLGQVCSLQIACDIISHLSLLSGVYFRVITYPTQG